MEDRLWAKVNTAMGRHREFEILELSSEFPRLESREKWKPTSSDRNQVKYRNMITILRVCWMSVVSGCGQ